MTAVLIERTLPLDPFSEEPLMPKLLIFASGTREGGGSGFRNLVRTSGSLMPYVEIVGVVSNHATGGVRTFADEDRIPFYHLPNSECTPERYRALLMETGAEFVALSGWLRPVRGLNPEKTFNIHPGPLPQFGGNGMYGRHVHEAVLAAFHRGEINTSAVTMHFVSDTYDAGPAFFVKEVPIMEDDTVDTLAKRVHEEELFWQPRITHSVVTGEIYWDGSDPASLRGAILT